MHYHGFNLLCLHLQTSNNKACGQGWAYEVGFWVKTAPFVLASTSKWGFFSLFFFGSWSFFRLVGWNRLPVTVFCRCSLKWKFQCLRGRKKKHRKKSFSLLDKVKKKKKHLTCLVKMKRTQVLSYVMAKYSFAMINNYLLWLSQDFENAVELYLIPKFVLMNLLFLSVLSCLLCTHIIQFINSGNT